MQVRKVENVFFAMENFQKWKKISILSHFRNMKVPLETVVKRIEAEVMEKEAFEHKDKSSSLGPFQNTDYQAFDSRKTNVKVLFSFFSRKCAAFNWETVGRSQTCSYEKKMSLNMEMIRN